MKALVRPPCTTSLTDGLCMFPCFAAPRSIVRYQRLKCSGTIPRERATCTVHLYSTAPTSTYCTGTGTAIIFYTESHRQFCGPPSKGRIIFPIGDAGARMYHIVYCDARCTVFTPPACYNIPDYDSKYCNYNYRL
jgi:hypothetical protein